MSHLVFYGSQKDGPVFSRACPKCNRYMAMPVNISWREHPSGYCEFIFAPPVTCQRCGPVEPTHLGWAGDFR